MAAKDITRYNLDIIIPIFLIILAEFLIFIGKYVTNIRIVFASNRKTSCFDIA